MELLFGDAKSLKLDSFWFIEYFRPCIYETHFPNHKKWFLSLSRGSEVLIQKQKSKFLQSYSIKFQAVGPTNYSYVSLEPSLIDLVSIML